MGNPMPDDPGCDMIPECKWFVGGRCTHPYRAIPADEDGVALGSPLSVIPLVLGIAALMALIILAIGGAP